MLNKYDWMNFNVFLSSTDITDQHWYFSILQSQLYKGINATDHSVITDREHYYEISPELEIVQKSLNTLSSSLKLTLAEIVIPYKKETVV